MREVRAGNGKTGPSAGVAQQANPLCNTKAWGSEIKVAKLMSLVPRKAAIVLLKPVP